MAAVRRTLTEVVDVRQVPGEPRRRWFESPDFDLVVWCDPSGAPQGFQLCYDKTRAEHALTWNPNTGLSHMAIDSGDNVGLGYKRAPMLVADGQFDVHRITRRFVSVSRQLPPEIIEFVCGKLRDTRAPAQASPAQP